MDLMKKIPLTQGHFALIDNMDWELLSKYKWIAQKHSRSETLLYVTTVIKDKVIRMHRLVTRAKQGEIVDHINGDGLDNRRKNLRFCTFSQNSANARLSKRNKTGFKGVCFMPKYQLYLAQMAGEYLGLFKDPVEAAIAYNIKAKKKYGKFAYQNKIK